MLQKFRTILFVLISIPVFAACTSTSSEQVEEPVMPTAEEEPPGEPLLDEGGTGESDSESSESFPEPSESDAMPLDEGFDAGSEDSYSAEPEAPAAAPAPEEAPSEKGGIISSGVKPKKKRCSLIADELERRKCLNQQSKGKRGN